MNAEQFYGRVIRAAQLTDDVLTLTFSDGSTARVSDQGQSCCEHRYITCDDDLNKIVGDTLRKIEARDGTDTEGEYGECHEKAFVEVATDKCFITLVTHNEHNGYYGGFDLEVTS